MESNDQLHRTLDDALQKTHNVLDAFTTIKQYLHTLETSYRKLETSYQQKCKEYDEYVTNHSEFNKVSFVSQLNRQIKEKDQQIADLQARLAKVSVGNLKPIVVPKEVVPIVREPSSALPPSEPIIGSTVVVPVVEPSPPSSEPEEEQAEDQETEEEEEESEEDEPTISYETVKLGKKYYYVSNESPQGIYEVLHGNEVGERIGDYVNEHPTWFPGKEPAVASTDKKKKTR